MSFQPLTKELVPRPELWQLALRLSQRQMDVLLYSPMESNSLIYRSVELDAEVPTRLKAIEAAVYDNPLLLSDFRRVSVIVENREFMVIPPEVESDEERLTLMETAYPGFGGKLYCNELGATNASMILGLDGDVAGFLERTFFNVKIYSHLTPLCRYFVSAGKRANVCRVYANLRAGAVDIVIVDHGEVKLLNTMACREWMDSVYYILASYKTLNLNAMKTELLICGSAEVREDVMPMLRNYVGSVMPVVFPSEMFKAGRDAMKAPFDLIVLPLCE